MSRSRVSRIGPPEVSRIRAPQVSRIRSPVVSRMKVLPRCLGLGPQRCLEVALPKVSRIPELGCSKGP